MENIKFASTLNINSFNMELFNQRKQLQSQKKK